MSLVGVFTVPGAQFPLTRVLESIPSARVEVDRLVYGDGGSEADSAGETPGDSVSFVFWTKADDEAFERVEARLRNAEGTREVTRLDTLDGQRLYRLRWAVGEDDLVAPLVELSGDLLAAAGTADACRLVVRFPGENSYEEFLAWCDRHDVPVEEAKRYTPASLHDLEEDAHADFLSLLFEVGLVDENAALGDLATALDTSVDSLPDELVARYRDAVEDR